MGYLAISIICAVVTGLVADRKNRSPILWGLLGLILGIIPVIVLLFLKTLPPRTQGA